VVRSRRFVAGLLLAFLLALTSCAGPARTDDSYASKAASTADQARSSVETVIVVVSSGRRHGLPSAYASTSVAEAESDADAGLATFESVQPPSAASDRVRAQTVTVVGDAVDLLARARVLVRRGENPTHLLPALRRSSAELDELATSVQA